MNNTQLMIKEANVCSGPPADTQYEWYVWATVFSLLPTHIVLQARRHNNGFNDVFSHPLLSFLESLNCHCLVIKKSILCADVSLTIYADTPSLPGDAKYMYTYARTRAFYQEITFHITSLRIDPYHVWTSKVVYVILTAKPRLSKLTYCHNTLINKDNILNCCHQ
jgi:hypothetical protein